nr:polyprenyltransferase 1 [Tanacetum cinerariifolium]
MELAPLTAVCIVILAELREPRTSRPCTSYASCGAVAACPLWALSCVNSGPNVYSVAQACGPVDNQTYGIHPSYPTLNVVVDFGRLVTLYMISPLTFFQDKEDDKIAGVKSTALRFGDSTKNWVSGFVVACISSLVLSGFNTNLGCLDVAVMLLFSRYIRIAILCLFGSSIRSVSLANLDGRHILWS